MQQQLLESFGEGGAGKRDWGGCVLAAVLRDMAAESMQSVLTTFHSGAAQPQSLHALITREFEL